MTKIALVTDTHFGVRNDNKHIIKNQATFFQELFFPYIDKYDIKHVIHLGDVFDRRKYVNFNTATLARSILFQPIYERGIETHVILGNHDVFYKNTNAVNSMRELYGNDDGSYFANMRVYEGPQDVEIAGTNFLMLPWINSENEEASYAAIKKSNSMFVCAHLELINFPMYKNSISDHGLDHRIFSHFEKVFTGHFHHKSINDNIHYLGAAGQYDWNDFNDTRGFHIMDTDTGEVEFILNPYRMFNQYNYDDVERTENQILNFNTEQFQGTYVKMVVRNVQNPYLLEKMIDKFENSDIVNLQVVEELAMYGLDLEVKEDDVVDDSEDTLNILLSLVNTGVPVEKQSEVKKLMTKVYYEAMTLG